MSQHHLNFLIKILQVTAESEGDTQVVYPLLAENTDKLDGVLAEILREWGTNTLEEADADAAKYIAEVIFSFSILIQQFPSGNKAANIEIAITGYEVILTFITFENSPQTWAATQTNLGLAYNDRVWGERAENIEKAIAIYDAVLTVITREASPQQWAETQINLGRAYGSRIRGNKAENTEKAIAASKAALTVITRESSPQTWAFIQNNIGIFYSNRIQGDNEEDAEKAIAAFEAALTVITQESSLQIWTQIQERLGYAYIRRNLGTQAENIENAIGAFKAALTVYTPTNFAESWAETQNELGLAHWYRIIGDRAENIENAIGAFKATLTVCTSTKLPETWGMTQNNLGLAYIDRIRGNKAKNIENAIAAFEAALTVINSKAFPQEWAQIQHNLGFAYARRIIGDRAENIEKAIAVYHAVLDVRKPEKFPKDWTETQNNLGVAYINRIQGDEAENVENAIAAFEAALTVRTRETFPREWAQTQDNLGFAYARRIIGDRAENIEKAITAFKNALTVRTREAFPQLYVKMQNYLGLAYNDRVRGERAESIKNAYTSFNSAIETVESLRSEILSGDETKRKHAEEWNEIYINMVKVCLKLGKNNEAIEYVERSKTRNLVELILDRDLKTIFPKEVANQLEQLQHDIENSQYKIQNGTAEDPKSLAQHLQKLRQQRQELQDRYLPVGSGFKFDQFQPTLDQRTAIIEWYITDEKILAFVIKPNGQELTVWQSQPEDLEALVNWVGEYLQDYDKTGKNQWRDQLDERLKQLSKILHIESILDQIPEKQYDRLILIPHRFLHLLPIHALSVGKSYLLDRFPQGVGYAPSCQLLQQVQQRKRPDLQSLFAIQNPTGDLVFTDQEVKSILSLFPSHQVLCHSHATKAALDEALPHLQEVNYLHFSCHGSFNPDSPFLLLADAKVSSIPTDADPKQYLETSKGFIDLSKCLTLGNLFERGFDIKKCRLVVLSACETGLIDCNNISDEYIGLPSGFLYAGSRSVVSSLWTVDDLSTAFLTIRFYDNLQNSEQYPHVAISLNQAQIWLRNLTKKELQEWILFKKIPLDATLTTSLRRMLYKLSDDTQPFQSPFYWAAFCAIGQ